MCVDGWLVVARKRYCFLGRFFLVASAILPFVLYSSTVKSGILYAFIHIASPVPSFHEVMIDDLSHPYLFLLSVEEVIDDLLSSSIDLFVVPSHLYKKKQEPRLSSDIRVRGCAHFSLAREIHILKKEKHTLATTFLKAPTSYS